MKLKINAEEVLENYLRQHSMRRTPERFAILKMAMSFSGHFEVDDLYRAMETDGYHVSRTTIYNAVELFSKCGLMRRLLLDSQKALYEVVDGNHAHLICQQCGKVREYRGPGLDEAFSPARLSGFAVSYVSATVYGVCAACQRKNRRRQRSSKKEI